MANGDTYHVTNCSPQTKAFNQSPHGQENWGDLEAEIEKQTKAERVMLFSGPVLDPGDPWFRGEDQAGIVRIQVPTRFWKIVVAQQEGRLRSYGFLLEQDVRSIIEQELIFSDTWISRLVPVADIAPLLRGWVDLSELERIN